MPRLKADVAPFQALSPTPQASARVVRIATQYKTLAAEIAIREIKKRKMMVKLLRATKHEGEPDGEGKLRLESDAYKLVIVKGESTQLDVKTLLALGVSAKILNRATKRTPFEYVRIDTKKEST